MKRFPAFLSGALVAAVSFVGLGAAPATAAGLACGDVVSTDVRLTADLVCTGDVGLRVGPGLTVNLNGHRLTGPGSGTGTGIVFEGEFEPADYTVRVVNGTVSGWEYGMTQYFVVRRVIVDRVRLIDNETALSNGEWSGFGFDVRRSTFERNGTGLSQLFGQSTIHRSTFLDNGSAVAGYRASLAITESKFERNETAVGCPNTTCDVDASTFLDNDTAVSTSGVSGGLVQRSRFVRNDVGVSAGWQSYTAFEGNTFRDNGVGIDSGANDGSTVSGNTFRGNETGFRSVTGGTEWESQSHATLTDNTFRANGDGIFIAQAGTSLGRNSAVRNTGWGVHAEGAVDLGGNTASNNGNDPQCHGVACG